VSVDVQIFNQKFYTPGPTARLLHMLLKTEHVTAVF